MLFQNENILPTEGIVFLFDSFYGNNESDSIFKNLKNTIDWKQEGMKIYGKKVLFPRLTAWYGVNDATYTYSGITNIPLPWTSQLLSIKERIEDKTKSQFNSVLLNYYRNGNDSMGWHSDDEKELGVNPIIASLSFGASRKFQFKHKTKKELNLNTLLTNGSLLMMSGQTQNNWLHQVPKSKKVLGERINLTFRNVMINSKI